MSYDILDFVRGDGRYVDVSGGAIGDNIVEGEMKQEGGRVNAWCLAMSWIRNRGALMAVRPRVEGRVSVFKGMSRISGLVQEHIHK